MHKMAQIQSKKQELAVINQMLSKSPEEKKLPMTREEIAEALAVTRMRDQVIARLQVRLQSPENEAHRQALNNLLECLHVW